MSPFRLDGPVEQGRHTVETALRRTARSAADRGLGVPEISGKLLRPLVAWALVPRRMRVRPGPEFSAGALAIQLAHEASLLHDDILDGAQLRRGLPSVTTRHGVGAALVAGDHYLTSAYVVAGDAASPAFVGAFARAVERTVAGEMRQGASCGQILSEETYESIIRGKSGELFGAAAVLATVVGGREVPVEFGLRIGSLYQRIDDLLDYCTRIEQDKPALQDWRQRKWTFPLGLAGVTDWNLPEADLLAALCAGPHPPLMMAVGALEVRAAAIAEDASRVLEDVDLLGAILDSWCGAARRGVEDELARVATVVRAAPIHQVS